MGKKKQAEGTLLTRQYFRDNEDWTFDELLSDARTVIHNKRLGQEFIVYYNLYTEEVRIMTRMPTLVKTDTELNEMVEQLKRMLE